MCRLLGVVVSEADAFDFSLRDAPRSLRLLSPDHPHGWGVAVHDAARPGDPWDVQRNTACARDDQRFVELAGSARGRVLIAHVRKATVGGTANLNTHPFRRGAWVFAHNGTIQDVAWCASRTSPERAREIEGETDSERFFAFVMTKLDEIGAGTSAAAAGIDSVDRALAGAVVAATSRDSFGAVNFLLSDGDALYAHRFGRTLFTLERGGSRLDSGSPLHPGSRRVGAPRKAAALVASEAPSDEAWVEVPERTLLRACVGATPRWEHVGAAMRRSA